jgi:hypothetical protein
MVSTIGHADCARDAALAFVSVSELSDRCGMIGESMSKKRQ